MRARKIRLIGLYEETEARTGWTGGELIGVPVI
jgi:hypothetical protein